MFNASALLACHDDPAPMAVASSRHVQADADMKALAELLVLDVQPVG